MAPENCSYVTLSYVWGQTEQFKLSSNNLNQGYAEIPRERCLKTIRDAMKITALLGERYLWVDTLCIVQDDEDERAATIKVMHRIYEDGKLTIVAADGENANSGIPQRKGPFTAMVQGVRIVRQEPRVDINQAPWNKRAWTYQEFHLSRRALIYMNGRIFFVCRTKSFAPFLDFQDFNAYSNLPRPLSSLNDRARGAAAEYGARVEEYTTRELTYQEDILDAFNSILSRLSELHDLKYCWGLPTSFFRAALCWEKQGVLTRRNGPASGSKVQIPSVSKAFRNLQSGFTIVG